MERLRASYEQAGKPDEAVRVALAMAQEYRYSAQPYVDAARIEVSRKRYDEALMYTLAATAREERANTVQLAGLLLLRQGDHARAMRYLERAAELAPNEQRMIIALRSAKAIPELEAGRLQSPRDTTLLYSLAGAYALTQQYEKSRETLAALEAIAPNHAGAKQLRKRLPPD
jgi:tetratricopeptide (TPR) repeat protein